MTRNILICLPFDFFPPNSKNLTLTGVELGLYAYGSLIFERGGEIGLKLEDEQSCKRKDRKSR